MEHAVTQRPRSRTRHRRDTRGEMALVAAVLLTVGCGGTSDPSPTAGSVVAERPNVLVILSDTHRFDHVSPYDGGERRTPNLELLGRRGVVLEEATTLVPISAPAYASLFTGSPPTEHGLLNNHQKLSEEAVTLAEQLSAAGYRTAGAVANPFCGAAQGFAQGFDFFWDQVEGSGKGGEHISREALAWIDAESEDPRPFFVFAALMDAHTPYVDPRTPASLLVEVDGKTCCLLRAEDSHRVQRIPFTARPGKTRITLRFLPPAEDDGSRHLAHKPLETSDVPSPLYLVQPTLDRPELTLEAVRGLAPPVGEASYRQLSQVTVFEVSNPGKASVPSELSFRAYRRYGPTDTPALYGEGVRAADRAVGALLGGLEARGLDDETVVIFLSDHGEMLGEHDAWGHVHHLWRPSLRIPLILAGPGIPRGRRWSGDFDLLDLHQLILALTLGEEPTAAGRALLAGVSTGEPAPDEPRVAATYPPEAETLRVNRPPGHPRAPSRPGRRPPALRPHHRPGANPGSVRSSTQRVVGTTAVDDGPPDPRRSPWRADDRPRQPRRRDPPEARGPRLPRPLIGKPWSRPGEGDLVGAVVEVDPPTDDPEMGVAVVPSGTVARSSGEKRRQREATNYR